MEYISNTQRKENTVHISTTQIIFNSELISIIQMDEENASTIQIILNAEYISNKHINESTEYNSDPQITENSLLRFNHFRIYV